MYVCKVCLVLVPVLIRSDSSELLIEESTQYVELEIRRSFGTFGEIMVTLNTVEDDALSPDGI